MKKIINFYYWNNESTDLYLYLNKPAIIIIMAYENVI